MTFNPPRLEYGLTPYARSNKRVNTMADDFRRKLDNLTGKGGVHCYCCNKYNGKERKMSRRWARRVLKNEVICDGWTKK